MLKDIAFMLGTLAQVCIIGLLFFAPALALAAGLEILAGRYVVENYGMVIANGAELDLDGMGFRDAEVSIFPDGMIVSRVTAPSGDPLVFKGRVTDVRMDGNQGSWVEHWPEWGFSLRREIERMADGFAFSARLEKPEDTLLQGAIERGFFAGLGA